MTGGARVGRLLLSSSRTSLVHVRPRGGAQNEMDMAAGQPRSRPLVARACRPMARTGRHRWSAAGEGVWGTGEAGGACMSTSTSSAEPWRASAGGRRQLHLLHARDRGRMRKGQGHAVQVQELQSRRGGHGCDAHELSHG
jgi:hypothetical protein